MKNDDHTGEIIIYQGGDGQPKIDVRVEGETVWLNQAQLVELFQSSKANVSEHIKNIFSEGELTAETTVRKFRTVQIEGGRAVSRQIEYYNLDLIISLGYRVKSQIATQFRQWATARLMEPLGRASSHLRNFQLALVAQEQRGFLTYPYQV